MADPDRLGTIMAQLAGVTVVCWLMGSAAGRDAADLHGPRLETLLERLVDTPVRGIVYEAAGSVEPALLAAGAAACAARRERWRMPAEVVEADPRRPRGLARGHAAAVGAAALAELDAEGARERERQRRERRARSRATSNRLQPTRRAARASDARGRRRGRARASARAWPAATAAGSRRHRRARPGGGADAGHQRVRGLHEAALVLHAARAVAQVHVEPRVVALRQRAVEAVRDQRARRARTSRCRAAPPACGAAPCAPARATRPARRSPMPEPQRHRRARPAGEGHRARAPSASRSPSAGSAAATSVTAARIGRLVRRGGRERGEAARVPCEPAQ